MERLCHAHLPDWQLRGEANVYTFHAEGDSLTMSANDELGLSGTYTKK